jgi:hypothetical protein
MDLPYEYEFHNVSDIKFQQTLDLLLRLLRDFNYSVQIKRKSLFSKALQVHGTKVVQFRHLFAVNSVYELQHKKDKMHVKIGFNIVMREEKSSQDLITDEAMDIVGKAILGDYGDYLEKVMDLYHMYDELRKNVMDQYHMRDELREGQYVFRHIENEHGYIINVISNFVYSR